MSDTSIEKIDVSHQESVAIDMMDAQTPLAQKKSLFAPPPTSELAEFQKTLIGPAIGFAAFALCSFVLGLYNTGLITDIPHVAIGIAFGYGSIGQFIAGIIEVVHKNVFAATSFITFASFFLAFGIMMVPGSGFLSMATAAGQLEKCLGLVEIAYAIAAFIFFLGTFRQPILVRLVLGFAFLSFLFPAIGAFSGIIAFTKIGGWCSFALGLVAWYTLMALIYNETNTFIRVPFF
ncbi:GPR1/FUN34/yaaH family-domain-containing protein [Gilbertella persicaria]|uniref:GPR1/FUN34/yaaH family-domain-containing protein n=1 Tax=Gilbertella persicaria TaxID=101096 RepID=UPI00221F36BB|nr:GPR1/FUN34/yaaH family-domain-containing protein [Gilbertella persicaria]KAI8083263.1 GPR1/FUN34/yaaH family-domain-containing protein [Gilbertella persicaria]